MGRKMYECESCKKTFNRCERLENHIKKGCNRTTCKTCNKKFRRATDVRRHERTHVPRVSQKECTTCGKTFKRARELQTHRKNADPVECDLCNTSFCHRSQLGHHKRTAHIVQGFVKTWYVEKLKRPIYPTIDEETEGYQEEMVKHINKIRDRGDEKNVCIFLNKQITEAFTYQDLQNLIYETAMDRGTAFKINAGFGLMLHHLTTKEVKYFYVSPNTLLFDVAYTISKRSDLNALRSDLQCSVS